MNNLNSSDWLSIQQALEDEIKRMKEYQKSPHQAIVESAGSHIERYETVLRKMEEMGLKSC
ncbi:MAG TPA: hypothetical protein GX731_02065 [Clostridiales bacterium]|nr:hypothetical protein [Clostridiales bacterium]